MDQLIEAVKDYGPFAVIAVYMIYQLRNDYRGICRRHNEVEDATRTILVDCVNNASRVNEKNTEVMERVLILLDKVTEKLD